ncbi:hypothetical protein COL87_12915 [Bacillus pseudomycoides]|nr:hypothetical protein bpmyx0001_56990 [Bacillus pseudomycoides DSM 12442]OOR52898.1 hypothetical protein BLX05_06610 [Bacillus pseudomycoides]PDY10809.1 hypothetical protein COO16_18545 [Bacillus pseudomycoides]PEB40833.1 hypothetical protein COO06_14615 [Bacillus pseudomycoides]PEF76348.1 hypothetical protein CON94_06280 [Bacillus pseudomycoides]
MLREIEHFILRNIDRKYINPFFLDGRERPAEHGSGQVLFSPHAEFKTKGEGESRSILYAKQFISERTKRVI